MIDKKLNFYRGDIVYADLNYMNTSNTNIQGELRPVIVVSNNRCNKHSPVVTVIPLTSNLSKTILPTHIQVWKESKITTRSIALCEQPQSIDRTRIIRIKGRCHSRIMELIDKAIAIQLGLSLKSKEIEHLAYGKYLTL